MSNRRPDPGRALLDAAEFAAERTAARLRLGVLVAIGALLAVLGELSGGYRWEVAVMFAVVFAVSLGAIVLTRPGIFRRWIPWATATLDAGVLLGIMAVAPRAGICPGAYTTALVAAWAGFVLLALAAIRLRPGLVLYLGLLLTAGIAVLSGLDPPAAPDPAAAQIGRIFDPEHNAVRLALLALTAVVLAFAVARARRTLREAVSAAQRSARLSRYFASGLLPLLAEGDLAALRQGTRQPAAILFADIRGFTARSEQLEPAALAEFLGAFRLRARRAIERHGGVVDKFVGDDVMGVFGVPRADPAAAAGALAAGRALLAEIEAWNQKRRRAGRHPVSIGIGIHYGEVFAGVVGDGEPFEFTVLGDAVNTAHRIEELTKTTGWPLLVSAELLAAAAASAAAEGLHRLPPTPVRGRKEPVHLYAAGRPAEAREPANDLEPVGLDAFHPVVMPGLVAAIPANRHVLAGARGSPGQARP